MGINPTPTAAECCKRLSIRGLHRILDRLEAAKNAEIRSVDRPDDHEGRTLQGDYVDNILVINVLHASAVGAGFIIYS